MRFLAALFLLLGLGARARAEMILDTSLLYFSDDFTTDSSNQYALTLWSASLNFEIGNSAHFFAGWNILGVNQSQSNTTSSSFTSTEMGPRIMYVSKNENFMAAVSYHLSSTNQASYDPGSGGAMDLKGTAIFAEIGYLADFSKSWRIGGKFNYYAPSFTQKVISNDYSDVSYTRAIMYPALAVQAHW